MNKTKMLPYSNAKKLRAINKLAWRLSGLIFVVVITSSLIIQSVAQVEASSDGGQAPAESELSLPKAFGEPRSIRVAPALGAVADQIPIVVPPGRRGVEPRLTLNYSSIAGLGTVGLGWFLETGYVEIWRGDGKPAVDNPDSYMYSLAGAGGQLVNIGNGIYRAKLESIYREFRRNYDHGGWEMYNGEGVLHRFGGAPMSRIFGQLWMLDLVQDPHGNTITYSYVSHGNELYVNEIKYTGYAPTGDPGNNLIQFDYEYRDDQRIVYGLSAQQEKTRRLRRISIFASGQLTRRYLFKYENSPLNGMSLLKEIILVGADDISQITLRELDYGTRSYGWDELTEHNWPNGTNGNPLAFLDSEGRDTGVRISDVNGDGFADSLTNDGKIFLGTGAGNFSMEPDAAWSDSLQAANVQFSVPSGDYKGTDNGVRLIDINSDGLPDLFIAQKNRRRIYLNTGSGWSFTEPVCSGNLCSTGEQWSNGDYGLDSIGSQAVYSNTILVFPSGIYDDTFKGWVYNGIWTVDSAVDTAHENTLHISAEIGNSASFTFHGIQFKLTYTGDTDRGQVEVYVDGELLGIVDQNHSSQEPQMNWASPEFSPGMHTVKFVHAGGEKIDIDALEILTTSTDEDSVSSIIPLLGYPLFEPFALVEDTGDSKGVQLVDVNADGRVDIVWSYSRTPKCHGLFVRRADLLKCMLLTDIQGVFLNTSAGWKLDLMLTEALKSIDFFVKDTQLMGYDMLDVNADGLADIVRTLDGEPLAVLLGNGSGWENSETFSNSLELHRIISLSSDRKAQGLIPADFNDDGLVDYLQANETRTIAYANTGLGWIEDTRMTSCLEELDIAFNTSEGKGTGVLLTELDGDGLIDIAQSKEGESIVRVLVSDSIRSGLLVTASSALGEVTKLSWAVSTQFDNRREDGVQGLPGPMPVVTMLTRNDGRDNAHTSYYEYGGGWFTNRQFRGFRWGLQILPSGLQIKTYYHQEEGLAGQRKVEYGLDEQDNVRIKNSSFFNVVDVAPGIKQLTNIRIEEAWSDSEGSRRSALEYIYDEHLNITSVLRDPDLDISHDETTTTFAWIINKSAGFWSLPGRVTTYGPDGSVLAENITLYDHLPEGQASHGLPSEICELVEPGIYVSKSMVYDKFGNVISIFDRESNLYQFQYDDFTATQLVEAVDPENRVHQSRYDPRFGNIIWNMDAAGNISTKVYDAFGRLVRIVLPGDKESPFGTKSFTYSQLGDANAQFYTVHETETSGQPGTLDTTYYFNGMGLIYRAEREGSGSRKVVTFTEFDDADNPIATSRPFFEGDTPHVTVIERDELHRPLRIIEPDGSQIIMTYAGKRVDVINQRGTKTSFYRNADGNTTAIHQWVDGVEQATHYTYDVLSQLTGIVDALGEQTSITYDMLGRRIQIVDPNAGTYQYQYDGEGNLIVQTGPDGLATTFEYNSSGDLLSKRFPDGSAYEFNYDSAGRLVQVKDAAGVVRVAYDGRGNVIERKRTAGGKLYTTKYSFDSLNRVQQVTYPDGFVVHYIYDAGGNLSRVTDSRGQTIAEGMAYSAPGQLLQIQYGNGARSQFTYDKMMRMKSIYTVTAALETLQNLTYSYDSGSNLISIIDHSFGSSQQFEYDAVGRLIKAAGAYGEEVYEYDSIGNLLRKGSMLFSVDPQYPQRMICGYNIALAQGNASGIGRNPHANPCDSTPGAMIQKPSEKWNRLGGAENNPNIARSFKLTYDDYGNVIAKGGIQYEYDFENHLVRVRDAKGKQLVENVYDAGGQRVIQRTPQGTNVYIDGIYEEGKTHTSRHVQAGPLLIATIVLPRSIAESSEGVVPNAYNAMLGMAGVTLLLVYLSTRQTGTTKGLTGLNHIRTAIQAHPKRVVLLLVILVALVSTAAAPDFNAQATLVRSAAYKYYYYHSNHLGSINVVTDEKGKVIERREYKPYGDSFEWSGPKSGPREFLQTFDGQYYDDQTGLYYFGARHYDPEMGRFLAADTQVPDPMNPKTLHRYAFAGGNPLRYVDPTGHSLSWFDWLVGIIVAIAFVVIGIVTCGFGIAIAAVAGGILLTLGMAAIGAGVFAVIALANGASPLSGTDFWLAVAGGAVIGAAVGACLAALPASIGGISAFSSAIANFAASMVVDIIVGAVLGGLGTVFNHLASGGSAADIFSESLGLEILTSSIKGALLSAMFGFVLNFGIKKIMGVLGAAIFSVVSGLLVAEGMGEIALNIWQPNRFGSLINFFGDDPNWFKNSPSKPLGIPGWVFEGTGAWTGANQSRSLAFQLQIMPLAP